MIVSDARRAANVENSKRSKGPVTAEGKAASSRNSLKHGLSGEGIVLHPEDQAEVERRVAQMTIEMDPRTEIGAACLRKAAIFSVRSERLARLENDRTAHRVRVAVHRHDEDRAHFVDGLFREMAHDPRGAVRNLRRMPEGVDRMLEVWRTLRRRLECEGPTRWMSSEMGRAVSLVGVRGQDAIDCRIGELSHATWGDFIGLSKDDGGGLDDMARREWARGELMKEIDARIAELVAHRETLDFDRIERERLEAPLLATFDDSPEGEKERRYEAQADRGFYKALKEFRAAEAEAKEPVQPEPEPEMPEPIEARMGSFREMSPPADPITPEAYLDDPALENPPLEAPKRGRSGRVEPQPPPG